MSSHQYALHLQYQIALYDQPNNFLQFEESQSTFRHLVPNDPLNHKQQGPTRTNGDESLLLPSNQGDVQNLSTPRSLRTRTWNLKPAHQRHQRNRHQFEVDFVNLHGHQVVLQEAFVLLAHQAYAQQVLEYVP
jgi:hypothetical protein